MISGFMNRVGEKVKAEEKIETKEEIQTKAEERTEITRTEITTKITTEITIEERTKGEEKTKTRTKVSPKAKEKTRKQLATGREKRAMATHFQNRWNWRIPIQNSVSEPSSSVRVERMFIIFRTRQAQKCSWI